MRNEDVIKRLDDLFKGISNIRIASFALIGGRSADAELVLKIADLEKRILLKIIKTSQLQRIKSMLFDLTNTGTDNYDHAVIVAPMISEMASKMIKEAGFGYMDMYGNAFISFENVIIDKRTDSCRRIRRRTLKNIFSRKASRIVRKLLSDPDRTWRLEDISKEANVSLGLASNEIGRLAEEGYVEASRSSIRLVRPAELLDAWSSIYRIESENVIGYFCPITDVQDIYDRLKGIPETDYALTLGCAAALVAPMVRSSDFNIYTYYPEKLIKVLEMQKVEFGGNVNLIIPYDEGALYDTVSIEGISVVSYVQLYMDLYQYPMRGREQSKAVRERFLRY
ncbi:MAG: type IV toxin-antitoxin system AbiEi family antitoxin [Candidatus Thermoplasmatota archaeon]|nr:type IV toxin-antitoxin system AbiEi family antitoxin [Candidatus Thermoplasmatota archaeon]